MTIALGVGCDRSGTPRSAVAQKIKHRGLLAALPAKWKEYNTFAVDELSDAGAALAVESVEPMIASLPPGMLAAIENVWICEEFLVSGEPALGTCFDRSVVVDVGDNVHVSETFFHEAASILLSDAPPGTWRAFFFARPRGFRYDLELDMDAPRGSPTTDPSLFEEGFLTAYSKHSPWQDQQTIAGRLFEGDPVLWGAYDDPKNGRLRMKIDAVVNYFTTVDPVMTEEWFRMRTSGVWR